MNYRNTECPLLGGHLEMNCLRVSSPSGGWLLEDPFWTAETFWVLVRLVSAPPVAAGGSLERSSLEKTASVSLNSEVVLLNTRTAHIKTYVWDLSNQAFSGGQH